MLRDAPRDLPAIVVSEGLDNVFRERTPKELGILGKDGITHPAIILKKPKPAEKNTLCFQLRIQPTISLGDATAPARGEVGWDGVATASGSGLGIRQDLIGRLLGRVEQGKQRRPHHGLGISSMQGRVHHWCGAGPAVGINQRVPLCRRGHDHLGI